MFEKILKTTYYISVLVVIGITVVFYLQIRQAASASEFSTTNIGVFMTDFYSYAIRVCIGLAVVVLIFAGYSYVTSAGNPDGINKAKELIIGALTGLVFLILASLVFNTLRTNPSGQLPSSVGSVVTTPGSGVTSASSATLLTPLHPQLQQSLATTYSTPIFSNPTFTPGQNASGMPQSQP